MPKRRYSVVDLTEDHPPPSSHRGRAPYHVSNPHSAIPGQQDDDSENSGADDIVISSQDDHATAVSNYQLYGMLDTKIVGVQYYSGYATMGEFVILRRQPANQYDRNAIQVTNVQREQIGHIPRTTASKLAKYMDNGSLLVEGSLAGRVGQYDCPVTLKLFGTSEPVDRANMRNQMKADRLPCQVIDEKEKDAKKRKAAELKKIAAAKGTARGAMMGSSQDSQQWERSSQMQYDGTLSSQATELSGQSQSLEEIMESAQSFNPREMGEVVEKFGMDEAALAKMPMAQCPSNLATQLLPYQRQALHWLLEKENPQLPQEGSDDTVQLWKRSKHHRDVFTNVATNFAVKGKKPVLASGGILSDDMGMGKTLEMISLMVSDAPVAGSCKSTLIVAPVGVMSNWAGQIAHHVKSQYALKTLIHHGNSKKVLKPEEISSYDVVVTSYATLATDHFPRGRKDPGPVPRSQGLFSVKWRRVILDEGHTVRNPQTKAALAASSLPAVSKWVLTGTPIINNLRDLYSLIRFIGLTGGLEQLDIFNSILARPVKNGDVNASLLLQALMATICLRRKKTMKFVDLRLPQLSEYVHRIEFLPDEREKYEAIQAEAKGLLHKVTHRAKHGKKQEDTYRHLLEVLLRLRQVCNHWTLCGERVTSILAALEDQKMLELTPENKKALQDMLQLSIDTRDDCPICLEPLHNPVITACAHSFGYECIERVIETQHRCPMCRADPLELETLVRPAVDLGESAVAQHSIDTEVSSSKIEALLSILSASQKKDKGTKTVIFSQWTSFLNIIQSRLDAHHFKYARIDGTMRPHMRDAALTALETDPDCTIMLASLAVCSVGLNLVAANQVILADSWWAPAIEDQAVDRVHRLGQTKETTVWRLVMDGTIEDTVLDIQAEKRKLMATAFMEKEHTAGKGRGKGQSTRLGDIERLLK